RPRIVPLLPGNVAEIAEHGRQPRRNVELAEKIGALLEQDGGRLPLLARGRGRAQVAQQPGDPEVVAELARDLQSFLPAFLGHLYLAQTEGDGPARRQRPPPHLRRRPRPPRPRVLEPAEAFA